MKSLPQTAPAVRFAPKHALLMPLQVEGNKYTPLTKTNVLSVEYAIPDANSKP